ncbi:MAG: GIY-YIG nuclease family protein [Geminicoccaceae bacterium]|jgi:hypothetical protein|nr:GIY-YIG nuclease family protein [Geminicoccaceae bacterium]
MAPVQLNDLLRMEGIDPGNVLVLRHRPFEVELRKVLPWLAAERPEMFNAYQQTQTNPKVEGAFQKATHIASFIGHQAGKALFIGLYERGGWRPLGYEAYWHVAAYREMKAFGIQGFTGDRDAVLWFDLELTEFYQQWRGRLIVGWPGLERSWWRWAERNIIPVESILEQSALDAEMPHWDTLTLTWDELKVLPSRWRSALSQWRGIYFIFDESDGKGYVGAAYGSDNILGRWLNYASTAHGGNKKLRNRDPASFRYSILQRVSPDMEPAEVIGLEGTWKDRLHTRRFGLNEN